MRKLTEEDLANIAGSTVAEHYVEDVRIKKRPFIDSDHYGFILGRNKANEYVTWQFHLLDDDSVYVYWGHYFMDDRDAAVRDFYTRDAYSLPQKFRVTITETLELTVEVEAEDQQQAEQKVSDNWHNSQYILDADNFAGVKFEAVPVEDCNICSLKRSFLRRFERGQKSP